MSQETKQKKNIINGKKTIKKLQIKLIKKRQKQKKKQQKDLIKVFQLLKGGLVKNNEIIFELLLI